MLLAIHPIPWLSSRPESGHAGGRRAGGKPGDPYPFVAQLWLGVGWQLGPDLPVRAVRLMAGDHEKIRRRIVGQIAAFYDMTYDQVAAAMPSYTADTDWYRAVGERLDGLGDWDVYRVSRWRLTWRPGRYVWVDRHLRVWRADNRGRLAVTANLGSLPRRVRRRP